MASYPPIKTDNRRAAERKNALDVQICLVELGQNRSAMLLDVSEVGIGVQSVEGPGASLTTPFRFLLPDTDTIVSGEGELAWADRAGRMGIRFTKIAPQMQEVVRKWVRTESNPLFSDQPETESIADLDARDRVAQLEARIIVAGWAQRQALNFLVDQIAAMTQASGVAIAVEDGTGIVCKSSSGIAPQVGVRVNPRSGLSWECARTGEVVHCVDTETDPRVDRMVCRELKMRSAMLVPVKKEGRVAGMVEVFSSRPQAFNNSTVILLRRLAEAVAALDETAPDLLEESVLPMPEPPAPVAAATIPKPMEAERKAPGPIPVPRPMPPPAPVVAELTAEAGPIPVPPTQPAVVPKPAAVAPSVPAPVPPAPPQVVPPPPPRPVVAAPVPPPVVPKPVPPPVQQTTTMVTPPEVASAPPPRPVPPMPAPVFVQKPVPPARPVLATKPAVAPAHPVPVKPIERPPVVPPPPAIAKEVKRPPLKPTAQKIETAPPPVALQPAIAAELAPSRPAVEKPVVPEKPIPIVSPAPLRIPIRPAPLPEVAFSGAAATPAKTAEGPVSPAAEKTEENLGKPFFVEGTDVVFVPPEETEVPDRRRWIVGGVAVAAAVAGLTYLGWYLAQPRPAPSSAPAAQTTNTAAPVSAPPAQAGTTNLPAAPVAASAVPAAVPATPPATKPRVQAAVSPGNRPVMVARRVPVADESAAAPPITLAPPNTIGMETLLAAPVAEPKLSAAVSRGVTGGKQLVRTQPVYPSPARSMHVSGTVSMTLHINKSGNVSAIEILKGHPMLNDAAVAAVRRWKYEPFLLNGQPIENDINVQVRFDLPR